MNLVQDKRIVTVAVRNIIWWEGKSVKKLLTMETLLLLLLPTDYRYTYQVRGFFVCLAKIYDA
jgi:hypothetical protein